MCSGLKICQSLWVILCRLSEKGRSDRKDSRGDERKGQDRKLKMKVNSIPHYSYLLKKNSRPCPTVSQYQLDTLVTKDTRHLYLTQPPVKSTTDFGYLMINMLGENFSKRHPEIFFFIFPRRQFA